MRRAVDDFDTGGLMSCTWDGIRLRALHENARIAGAVERADHRGSMLQFGPPFPCSPTSGNNETRRRSPPPAWPTERDDTIVTSRLASDSEVTTWQEDGWVLIEGLVGTEEIDAVAEDVREIFPSAEELHADPEGVTERWKGRPVETKEVFEWPDEGPGFRPEQ